ncbi:putative non-specific serine/threonine protein kinase [Helianthus annuus]|nr:putative non-specific serine/threonine protein kinase [Helianthus annuus]
MPKELVEGERTNYANTSSDQSLQSIEEINRIIQEAKTPGEGSTRIGKTVMGEGSSDPDDDEIDLDDEIETSGDYEINFKY